MKTKIISLIILLFFQVSCKESLSKPIEEEKINKEVNIVYSNGSEGIAVAFLIKTVLEENLEYVVNLSMAELEAAYEQLSLGEQDLMLNAWLPETHKEYFKQKENNLSLAGTVYEDAEIGFLVPEEAEIKSIEDIIEYSDTIYGIKSSARFMEKTKLAIEEYELDVNLMEEDEEKMVNILDEKFNQKQPVVVTGWKPHPVFSKYRLKLLKDPKNIFPQSERIYTVVNNDFSERDKVLMDFFSRFSLTQNQILSLIKEVEFHPSGEGAGAKKWIKDHQQVVSEWVRNLDDFKIKPL